MSLVVDASVALKWVVNEAWSSEAQDILAEEGELYAPPLLLTECGNALWRKVRVGGLSASDARECFTLLRSIPVTEMQPPMARALDLSIALDHPIYDCVYLALAESIGCRTVTADERFLKLAASQGLGHLVRALVTRQ